MTEPNASERLAWSVLEFMRRLPTVSRTYALAVYMQELSAQVLAEAGIRYRLSEFGDELVCAKCGTKTRHPEDIRQFYCAYCHEFLNDDLSGRGGAERASSARA